MRDFQRKPGRLGALPIGARVLYSVYLVFALAALTVAATLYQAGPTLDTDDVAIYYAGGVVAEDAVATPDPAEPPADGPALDLDGLGDDGGPALDLDAIDALPADALPVDGATRIAAPYNERRLLEVTHGHLFVMPLFFLVVAHLFVLAGLRPAVTTAFVAGGALAIALHIAGPWLVLRDAATWAFVMPLSGVAMLCSLGAMAGVSLVAMWLPSGRRETA